ncbi:hypothetical protein FVER14953_20559 [Fusarium verticillioides]|nr:hypothetical protein FVER14953_20559 [Fusarium verticillioides]
MLRTRQAAKAIRAVANARSFTTTSAVASVHTSKKVASSRNQSTAAAPARDIPSPGFNVEKNQSNVQPLVNPRKNDMDESFIGKTGGEIFHEMMLRHGVKHICTFTVLHTADDADSI